MTGWPETADRLPETASFRWSGICEQRARPGSTPVPRSSMSSGGPVRPNLLAAALATPLLAAACSTPPGSNPQREVRAAPLIIPSSPGSAQTSALEAGHDGLDLLAGAAPAPAAPARPQRPAAAERSSALQQVVNSAMEPQVSVGPGSRELPAPGSAPAAPVPPTRHSADGTVLVREARDSGQVIIIRGGVTRDPCARHGPPRPVIPISDRMPLPGVRGGVLVNDRAPRFGGRTDGNWRPRGGIR